MVPIIAINFPFRARNPNIPQKQNHIWNISNYCHHFGIFSFRLMLQYIDCTGLRVGLCWVACHRCNGVVTWSEFVHSTTWHMNSISLIEYKIIVNKQTAWHQYLFDVATQKDTSKSEVSNFQVFHTNLMSENISFNTRKIFLLLKTTSELYKFHNISQ
jgi:hypothetical protein